MSLIRLSIFSKQYMTQLASIEECLTRADQRLALIKKKIKTLQEALPSLTDNSLWEGCYLDLEALYREEIRVTGERNDLWAQIKTIITEDERKPDCPVVKLRSSEDEK